MGALFNNVCYPTQDIARQQACATFDAKVMATTNLYTTECTSTTYTATTMTLCKRTNGGTCTNISQPWPVTPACDYDGGVTLAYDWFLASVAFVVICWGGKKLINLFNTDTVQS
jgi:hypothetical protein